MRSIFPPSTVGLLTDTQGDVRYRSKDNIVSVANPVTPTTNMQSAIQAAHDAVVASGKHGYVSLPATTLKVNSGLNWDVSKVGMYGNGATLDFSGMSTTGGAAIHVFGSEDPPYYQATQSFEKVTLVGPGMTLTPSTAVGTAPANTGLYFYTDQTGSNLTWSTAHTSYRDLVIRGFDAGIHFWNNSYCQQFYNCNINLNHYGIYDPSGGFNRQERQSFIGGTVANNRVGTYTSGGELFFSHTSFDYNYETLYNTASSVFWENCHHEVRYTDPSGVDLSTKYAITLNTQLSLLVVVGGTWTGAAAGGTPVTRPGYVNLVGTSVLNSGFFMLGGRLFNCQSTGAFTAGSTSHARIKDTVTTGTNAALPGNRENPRAGALQNVSASTIITNDGNVKHIQTTGGGSITMVGANPGTVLAAGLDDQEITLINVSLTDSITLPHGSAYNLRLDGGTNKTLAPRASIRLIYIPAYGSGATLANWVQISPVVSPT